MKASSCIAAPAGHTIATVSDSHSRALPLAATWLLAFAAVLAFLWPLTLLYDGDSYYHLAIARAYLQRGLFSDLPWARFSVLHESFADKELLFHVLLLPAAMLRDPVVGAKLTLAVLDASILTSFAWLCMRIAGTRALALPLLALLGSFWFDMRLIRLRPELLALLLLLWTVSALIERRALLAAACGFAFALGYTAFHALLGICGLCFAVRYASERKPSWSLLLGPLLGVISGLVLHPQFPRNLHIFYLQNVEFWRYQDSDDIGNEILALGWLRWLRFDWPLLLGCAILFATLRRGKPLDRAMGLVCCCAALPLVLLFVHSGRFAVYGVPFGLLAALCAARLAGYQLDARLWIRGRPGPQAWLVLLLLGSVAAPLTAAAVYDQVERAGCVWPAQKNELEALARALPNAAKVAATWDNSEDYMYFAPQGRYLNVLDPLFMRVAYPEAYATQRALFAGQLADVPLALQTTLDSDFLAFPAREHPALREQLTADPRVEPVSTLLYRVRPERARAFVREYRVAPSRQELLQPSAAHYPRHPTAAGRASEAVIDAARLPTSLRRAADCIWFAPEASPDHGSAADYELASTVPVRLWSADRLLLTLAPSAQLRLGSGTRVGLAGMVGLALELCPAGDATPAFYLLRRD